MKRFHFVIKFEPSNVAPNSEKTFYVKGTAGGDFALYNDSNERLKKNINTIPDALSKVKKLRGVNFEWKDENCLEKGIQMGFIAQEAKEVIPEVVSYNNDNYSMQYAPVTAILVEAVKEQQKTIERLESELKEFSKIREENQEIKSELENIKTLLEALVVKE